MATPTTTETTILTIQELALADVGLDTRPERQIRALDMAWVRHLAEETDPDEWDPIQVRCWPEGDPYPPGEEGRPWQVISGYHRTTAARVLSMPAIRAQICDAPDDAAFTLLALKGNTRHGKPMSSDELRAQVRRLRTLGLSEREIAKQTSIPKGTIHNWLSNRDTNAGRPVRTHKASGDVAPDDGVLTGIPVAWRTEAASLDAQRIAEITNRLNKAVNFGDLTTTVSPSEAVTWLAHQSPAMRRLMAERFEQIALWRQGMSARARLACASSGDREEGGK